MAGRIFHLDAGPGVQAGDRFLATERHVPAVPPFGRFTGEGAEQRLSAWVAEKWNILFQLKRGEQERLKTCELFYGGFHYENAWDNRANPITNYCFSNVETVWPILTEARPRPEPVPRFGRLSKERADRLRDFATYKMDTCGFDSVFALEVRDFLVGGWVCPMIGWDAQRRAVPRYLSYFDFYPDQAANESEMECFAIARPVAVRRLHAAYPHMIDRIKPDNIASPGYEVYEQPYLEMASVLGGLHSPTLIGTLSLPSAIMEGGVAATTTGEYGIDTGSFNVFGQSAFLIQMFVRDYTTMPVLYKGDLLRDHEAGELRIPYSKAYHEPCCPSGWRMIPMLADGTILDKPKPVDACLNGLPVVIGRNYAQGGRFYGRGELDHIIPIQRDINRTDAMIARALELQSNPPVLVSGDARLSVDKASVEGGELLRHTRGSTISYLQPNSLAESHFVRRIARRQDIQIIGGTPDALAGQRPVGIEAGTAIRQLTESATTRARAKGPELLRWAALLLQKLMRADAYKSTEPIYFRGNDGREMWMDPAELRGDDWDLRWAQGTGTAQAEQDRHDQALQFFQMGIIDAQEVLDNADYPDRANILARVGLQQMQAAAAQAAASKGKSKGNGNGGGP